MSAPKTAFLSSDLLRETRNLMTTEAAPITVAVLDAAARMALAAAAPERERLYLRYGGRILEALEAAAGPLTDREMFERIRDGEFPQFRIALAELVQRGLIQLADRDPVFADQRYILTPAAA